MRNRRALLAVLGPVAVLAIVVMWRPPRGGEALVVEPSAEATLPSRGASFRLTLGLTDREPTDWSGELAVRGGSPVFLVTLPDWEPLEGGRWELRTTRQPGRRRAGRQPAPGPVRPRALLATLEASGEAMVRVETRRGRFSFRLREIGWDAPSTFLDGAVSVERLPTTCRVTATDADEDFPATATAPDGTVWCALVAYRRGSPVDQEEVSRGEFESLVTRGNGDQVRLQKFREGRWSPSLEVTATGLDVWRPAVAVDGNGTVWVIWSQNIGGNWELLARSHDPAAGTLGRERRLTTAPGADINVVALGDPEGTGAWIAWQGWRDANFDILLARLSAEGLPEERRMSTSAASDWSPAIARSDRGELWIAWDTYDRGNYDVLARRFSGGRPGETIAVADSPRFEARVSIAAGKGGRIWVAHEDAGANWGKDYGDRWPGSGGVPFYIERNIIVHSIKDGKVEETRQRPESGLIDTIYDDRRKKTEKRQRMSVPRVAVDGHGRPWLLYRRHPLENARGERWVSFATYLDGSAWSRPVKLEKSDNLLDNRPALLPHAAGGLLVVYSGDGRLTDSRSARNNDLYAAILEAEGPGRTPDLVAARGEGDGEPLRPVHPDEAADVHRLRSYRIEAGGRTYRLLRGEFHRHTEMSAHRDWDGPLEEVWRYGLDVASMDWIGPGDHDYATGQEYMWWLTQKQIDLYHHAPSFVPMFTYERSVSYPSGHRNVMFAQRGIRTLPRMGGGGNVMGTAEEGSPDIHNLYGYLKRFGGICSSHTSATNMGTDWRDNDPAVEPVVEIFQGHRQNYEEPGAPLAARTAEESIQGYHPDGFVWRALARGHRLGFQASSDHVSTHISYGIVLAEEATREGILNAFKKRHSYAAHDNIILDVRSGEHLMGDEFTVRERPALDIFAAGTAPIARVDIIRHVGEESPAYVYHREPGEREVRLRWMDMDPRPGSVHMYYVRIEQVDRKLAWASPLWITYRPR